MPATMNDCKNIQINLRSNPVDNYVRKPGDCKFPSTINAPFFAKQWKVLKYFNNLSNTDDDPFSSSRVEISNVVSYLDQIALCLGRKSNVQGRAFSIPCRQKSFEIGLLPLPDLSSPWRP